MTNNKNDNFAPQIGVDLLELTRLKLNDDFLARVLTINEIKKLKEFELENRQLEFLGGRWAAKEALYKVLDKADRLPFNQIELDYDQSDRPYFKGEAFQRISLSISHDKNYVIATVLRW